MSQNPSSEVIISAVLALINAENKAECKRVLENQREILLTDAADQLLADWLEPLKGNPDHTRLLQERRAWLARCRREEIDEVFAQRPSKAKIRQAIFALLNANGPTQRRQVVEGQRQVLLTDAADEFLAKWIELEEDSGDSDPLHRLQECRDLLIRCQKEGIDAAFTERLRSSSSAKGIPPELAADIGRAVAARERLEMDNSRQALDSAVNRWQAILARPEIAQYPDFALKAQWEFADTLQQRYLALGQPADLERAIRLYGQALAATPDDTPHRPTWLNNLGNALSNRFDLHGQAKDLQQAISIYEQALAATPDGTPDRLARLNNLGSALSKRFGLRGQAEDLERAIRLYEEALAATPDGAPDRSIWQNNLGLALSERFGLRGQAEDLDQAIRLYEQALAVTPDGAPDRSTSLNNLGSALSKRFDLRGQAEDLQRAISLYEQALAATPDGAPDRPFTLNNLAIALYTRFGLHGQAEDLQRAIRLYEQALAATPNGAPDRPRRLNNLGNALSERFDLRGQVVDLERAITFHEQALAATPNGAPDRSTWLYSLGNGLYTRFGLRGQAEDLDQAIRLYEQALAAIPDGAPDRSKSLNNLGLALSERFALRGQAEDLDQAIRLYKQALAATPDGAPDRPGSLNNLGLALFKRFRLRGQAEDLDRAISFHEQALAATPDAAPDRPSRLNYLGTALSERFGLRGQAEDLQRAIRLCEQALANTPDGAPDRPGWLNNLGLALSKRFDLRGQAEDLERAIASFQEGLALFATGIFPAERRVLARNLGNLYYEQAHDLAKARQAYEKAVAAAEAIHRGARSERAKQRQAAENAFLYARLVSCCLYDANPDEAAAFKYATAGKGRVFVDLLSTAQIDLTTLAAQDKALQEKVEQAREVRARIDALFSQLMGQHRPFDLGRDDSPEDAGSLQAAKASQGANQLSDAQRTALQSDLQRLREQEKKHWHSIRDQFPDYFATQSAAPFTLEEAHALARQLDATLVSYYRHDQGWVAFVIRADLPAEACLKVVNLPVTDERLLELRRRFYDDKLARCAGSNLRRLKDLYDVLIQPLRPYLPAPTALPVPGSQKGPRTVGGGHRLVLAPFSLLHLFPLAALRQKIKKRVYHYLGEQYVVSITPSLAMLNRVKDRVKAERSQLCALAYPSQKGSKHYLPNVVPEVKAIGNHFPKQKRRLFVEAQATPEAAFENAPDSHIMHYACQSNIGIRSKSATPRICVPSWATRSSTPPLASCSRSLTTLRLATKGLSPCRFPPCC